MALTAAQRKAFDRATGRLRDWVTRRVDEQALDVAKLTRASRDTLVTRLRHTYNTFLSDEPTLVNARARGASGMLDSSIDETITDLVQEMGTRSMDNMVVLLDMSPQAINKYLKPYIGRDVESLPVSSRWVLQELTTTVTGGGTYSDRLLNIGEDLKGNVKSVIRHALVNGSPFEQVSSKIHKLYGIDKLADPHFVAEKSESIYRAEARRMWNALLGEHAKGLDVTEVWFTTLDEATTPGCAARHGIPMDELSQRPPMHMRCVLPGTRVRGVFLGGARMQYDGPAFRIETEGGRRLSVTANHPILTERGFLRAQRLHPGDRVLRRRVDVEPTLGVDDEQDAPATVEEIFQALRLMRPPLARALADDDLYGDGAFGNGQVEIVRGHAPLMNRRDPAPRQGSLEWALMDALCPKEHAVREARLGVPDDDTCVGMGRPPQASGSSPRSTKVSLTDVGIVLTPHVLFPLHACCMAPASQLDAAFIKAVEEYATVQSSRRAQRSDGLASFIARDQPGEPRHRQAPGSDRAQLTSANLGHEGGVTVFEPDAIAAISQDAAEFLEALVDQGAPNAEFTSYVQDRCSGSIAADRIVHIERFHYVGLVYDLESTTGLMIADEILTKQCRCSPALVPHGTDLGEYRAEAEQWLESNGYTMDEALLMEAARPSQPRQSMPGWGPHTLARLAEAEITEPLIESDVDDGFVPMPVAAHRYTSFPWRELPWALALGVSSARSTSSLTEAWRRAGPEDVALRFTAISGTRVPPSRLDVLAHEGWVPLQVKGWGAMIEVAPGLMVPDSPQIGPSWMDPHTRPSQDFINRWPLMARFVLQNGSAGWSGAVIDKAEALRLALLGETTRRVGEAWDPAEHPRGQPDNAGQFASGGGGGDDAKSGEVPIETKDGQDGLPHFYIRHSGVKLHGLLDGTTARIEFLSSPTPQPGVMRRVLRAFVRAVRARGAKSLDADPVNESVERLLRHLGAIELPSVLDDGTPHFRLSLANLHEAEELLEAEWDPAEHPKHPAGAPGGKGGEFAPKGGGESPPSPSLWEKHHPSEPGSVTGSKAQDEAHKILLGQSYGLFDAEKLPHSGDAMWMGSVKAGFTPITIDKVDPDGVTLHGAGGQPTTFKLDDAAKWLKAGMLTHTSPKLKLPEPDPTGKTVDYYNKQGQPGKVYEPGDLAVGDVVTVKTPLGEHGGVISGNITTVLDYPESPEKNWAGMKFHDPSTGLLKDYAIFAGVTELISKIPAPPVPQYDPETIQAKPYTKTQEELDAEATVGREAVARLLPSSRPIEKWSDLTSDEKMGAFEKYWQRWRTEHVGIQSSADPRKDWDALPEEERLRLATISVRSSEPKSYKVIADGEDYERTQAIAERLSLARSAEVGKERGLTVKFSEATEGASSVHEFPAWKNLPAEIQARVEKEYLSAGGMNAGRIWQEATDRDKSRIVDDLIGHGKIPDFDVPVTPATMRRVGEAIWGGWKTDSHSRLGMALQVAVMDELGAHTRFAPGTAEGVRRSADDDLKSVGGYPALKAYVRGLWDTSQFLQDKAGVSELDIFRAVMLPREAVASTRKVDAGEKATPSQHGDITFDPKTALSLPDLPMTKNAAASFTADPQVANEWNGIGSNMPMNPERVVIKAKVPATAVLSLPVYGKNVHGEKEVVVLGVPWKDWTAYHKVAPGHAILHTAESEQGQLFAAQDADADQWLWQKGARKTATPPVVLDLDGPHWLTRRATEAWDEEDHPRQPEGAPASHGGEFAPAGGGEQAGDEERAGGSHALPTSSPVQWRTPTAEEFIRLRNQTTRPQFLSEVTPDGLADHRLVVSQDGLSGFALDSDGDIQNLFNNGPKGQGAGTEAMLQALRLGGKTLDCYAGYLAHFYSQFGFVETGRMDFDPALAHGWDVATGGQPDVVFMAWKGLPDEPDRLRDKLRTKSATWPQRVRSTRRYPSSEWDRAKQDARDSADGGRAGRTAGGREARREGMGGAAPGVDPGTGPASRHAVVEAFHPAPQPPTSLHEEHRMPKHGGWTVDDLAQVSHHYTVLDRTLDYYAKQAREAEWDEKAHPRQPEGAPSSKGGEFAPAGGGGAAGATDKGEPEKKTEKNYSKGGSGLGTDSATGRTILQPSNDPDVLMQRAEEAWPVLRDALDRIVQKVPGVTLTEPSPGFENPRLKRRWRLEEKIAQGKPPNTISDYLGARLSIPNDAGSAVLKLLDGIGMRVIHDDNFLGKPKFGYRARHVQVLLRSGVSAEIELVPREIAEVMEESHKALEKLRAPGASDKDIQEGIAESEAILVPAWGRWKERLRREGSGHA